MELLFLSSLLLLLLLPVHLADTTTLHLVPGALYFSQEPHSASVLEGAQASFSCSVHPSLLQSLRGTEGTGTEGTATEEPRLVLSDEAEESETVVTFEWFYSEELPWTVIRKRLSCEECVPVEGAWESVLYLNNAKRDQAGYFQCRASYGSNVIYSRVARLDVNFIENR